MDVAEFKERAERIAGVRSIRFGEDPELVEVSMDDGVDLGEGMPRELIEALNAVGSMRSLEIRTPTLDDVFVKLVGTTIARVEAAETT